MIEREWIVSETFANHSYDFYSQLEDKCVLEYIDHHSFFARFQYELIEPVVMMLHIIKENVCKFLDYIDAHYSYQQTKCNCHKLACVCIQDISVHIPNAVVVLPETK